MGNNERKLRAESVDLFIAVKRKKDYTEFGVEDSYKESARIIRCVRSVISDYNVDLAVSKERLKNLGGIWRIYKTVNKRRCDIALRILLKKFIDYPELASAVDSIWRTALLQPECKEKDKKFLLDVDTKDEGILFETVKEIFEYVKEVIKTPNGYHVVAKKFDIRKITENEKLKGCVTVQRDGYVFIERVKFKERIEYEFDGTRDYLIMPDSNDWSFGSGDFAVKYNE